MSASAPPTPPPWLDRGLYPFASAYLDVGPGHLHYVDEGAGTPVLFVHGNPDWSFAYRKLIQDLRTDHRCIALDHLGFGLSDKPEDFDYLPRSHAANVAALCEHLDLRDLILVVNDWGGPTALPWALDHPERVRAVVLMNTWLWSANRDPYYELFSRLLGGPLGPTLIGRLNLFAGVLLPLLVRNPEVRRNPVRRHFTAITPGPQRRGSWTFPREIIRSGAWLDEQWSRIDRLVDTPATIIWGTRDPIFVRGERHRWHRALPLSRLVELAGVAHYPHEDRPDLVAAEIRRLSTTRGSHEPA